MDGTTLQRERIPRREFLGRMAILGAGSAAISSRPKVAWAQPTRVPMKLTYWTWEQPQHRGWLHKRITQYTEKFPNIKVDFQSFTFTDLGKKVSVGFATGTAPDGFNTGDWLMPTWLARNLIAPLDVQRLGYPSIDAYRKDHTAPFSRAPSRTVRPTATRSGSTASATSSTPSTSRRSVSTRSGISRRPMPSSARWRGSSPSRTATSSSDRGSSSPCSRRSGP